VLPGKRNSASGRGAPAANFTVGASILSLEYGLPKQREVPCCRLRKVVTSLKTHEGDTWLENDDKTHAIADGRTPLSSINIGAVRGRAITYSG